MYRFFLRPLVFCIDPEKVHLLTLWLIKKIYSIPPFRWFFFGHRINQSKYLERECFGVRFPSPVGLAAGMDKNASYFKEFSQFGFGFIEVGTITPLPQKGNPKKRLFRLHKDKALINRMGFNNDGLKIIANRLKRKDNVVVGANIGKNKDTPLKNAFEDYKKCFAELYDKVDYLTINISSPNTPNLRNLQNKEPLNELIGQLNTLNSELHNTTPLLLKIAPDLSENQLDSVIEVVEKYNLAGIIAVNTTIIRNGLSSKHRNESGGLSGKPLFDRSIEVVRYIKQKRNKNFCIIGVGGIHSVNDALLMFESGADLIQIYTGLVYQGPALIRQINNKLVSMASGSSSK